MSFYTKVFKKDFEFDVKSLFFLVLVNSAVKVQLTAAKPQAERSEANKFGGEAPGLAK